MKMRELLSAIYRILLRGKSSEELRIQSQTWQLESSNQRARNAGNRPMRVREITLWGQRQILYLRMPAPIREQGMPVLDQSECDNKAKIENRLENGKSPREWKIPKEATVGKWTLGVTSILTKLRWDGGMIRMIVIRAMLVIQAMLLIQVCYNRLRAMILQATGHDTTGYEPWYSNDRPLLYIPPS